MNPAELITVANSAPAAWQSVLQWLGWGALGVTLLARGIAHMRRTGKKAVDSLAEKVMGHTAFEGMKHAAAHLDTVVDILQENAATLADIKARLDTHTRRHRLLARVTLSNSLTALYYDMLAKPRFNNSMYKAFCRTLALYREHKFNGEIDGYARVLKEWQRSGVKPG